MTRPCEYESHTLRRLFCSRSVISSSNGKEVVGAVGEESRGIWM